MCTPKNPSQLTITPLPWHKCKLERHTRTLTLGFQNSSPPHTMAPLRCHGVPAPLKDSLLGKETMCHGFHLSGKSGHAWGDPSATIAILRPTS